MFSLERTSDELATLQSTGLYRHGEHFSESSRIRHNGEYLGERDFDPHKDDPSDIDPLSYWQDIVDTPQVVERRPFYPLDASIIVHQPMGSQFDEELNIGSNRRLLARMLGQAIESSIPNVSDRTYSYFVGEKVDKATHKNGEVIKTDGNPESDAKIISEIALNGLTFVISDFIRLNFNPSDAKNIRKSIAVKANVPFDLSLNPGVLVLRSGERGGESNTRKNESLNETNNLLLENHIRVIEKLRSLGLGVAKVAYLPSEINRHKNDIDKEIATAIRSLSTQALAT